MDQFRLVLFYVPHANVLDRHCPKRRDQRRRQNVFLRPLLGWFVVRDDILLEPFATELSEGLLFRPLASPVNRFATR